MKVDILCANARAAYHIEHKITHFARVILTIDLIDVTTICLARSDVKL